MLKIGAFEAKNKLGRLLDLVERGGEIIITRHRREMARLVPPQTAVNREQARAAVNRIRERAEKLKLGPFEWAEWKSYRDQGRPCAWCRSARLHREALKRIKGSRRHCEERSDGCGRDAHYCTPPAQNRTCGFPAYGSHLG